jgi:hypothetical protein
VGEIRFYDLMPGAGEVVAYVISRARAVICLIWT